MRKYQIIESLFIGIAIMSFLSLLNKAFYINKHIRIDNAYIWAPQNRFRINKQGYLVRVDVKELSVIKKGTKLAYIKLERDNTNEQILKTIKEEQKHEMARIDKITGKLDYALKENGARLKNLTRQLELISNYLSELLVEGKQSREKARQINGLLLGFYRDNLKKEEAKQARLKRLYKKGLISSLQARSEDAKINNMKKIIKKLEKGIYSDNSIKLIETLPKNTEAKKIETKDLNTSSTANEISVSEKKPEQYSYISSDTDGIVYKITVPVPSEIYPRDTLFLFYKPEKMRVVAYYHMTTEINKGADVIVTVAGKKIKGRIDEIDYNSNAATKDSALKLIIKPEGSIAKYPLFTPVIVDVKQSKWF